MYFLYLAGGFLPVFLSFFSALLGGSSALSSNYGSTVVVGIDMCLNL